MNKGYSQYGEDKIIFEFFDGYVGTLLDLGANDGKTISNSFLFIENGWSGSLIEASPITFSKLNDLYKGNERVECVNACLSTKNESTKFYHNVTHFGSGDQDLLSTIVKDNYLGSISGNKFEEMYIECYNFETIYSNLKFKKFDYLSIDIEGMDYEILNQINLDELGVKILVIEYNSNDTIKNNILNYCNMFGMNRILHENGTNIIITK